MLPQITNLGKPTPKEYHAVLDEHAPREGSIGSVLAVFSNAAKARRFSNNLREAQRLTKGGCRLDPVRVDRKRLLDRFPHLVAELLQNCCHLIVIPGIAHHGFITLKSGFNSFGAAKRDPRAEHVPRARWPVVRFEFGLSQVMPIPHVFNKCRIIWDRRLDLFDRHGERTPCLAKISALAGEYTLDILDLSLRVWMRSVASLAEAVVVCNESCATIRFLAFNC